MQLHSTDGSWLLALRFWEESDASAAVVESIVRSETGIANREPANSEKRGAKGRFKKSGAS